MTLYLRSRKIEVLYMRSRRKRKSASKTGAATSYMKSSQIMICKKLSQIPKLLKNAIEPEIKKQEKEVNNNDISLDTKKKLDENDKHLIDDNWEI